MSGLSVEIGHRIRSYRLQRGWSQEELAERCGLHPTYIGQLERGEKNATLESVSRIAGGLSLTLSKLFENLAEDGGQTNLPAAAYDLILPLPVEKQKIILDILRRIVQLQ